MPLLSEQLRPSASDPGSLLGGARRLWEGTLRAWREQNRFQIILWGPPGSGKTTLARMLAESSGLHSVMLSAVRDGVREIRSAAESHPGQLLFIDEIHRLNKAQQDVLLPILEEGAAWVIGATTESPQVSLTPAMLSRVRTFYCQPPTETEIVGALEASLPILRERAQGRSEETPADLFSLPPPPTAAGAAGAQEEAVISKDMSAWINKIARVAKGDVRFAYNLLESVWYAASATEEQEIFSNTLRSFTEKQHYDWISAFIKSMRGSDPDAALFYAFQSLDSGEDPLFLARRCIIFASEDVGNADPTALGLAVNALRAIEAVGMPEGRIPLAQCVTYLASTVKSNRAYKAIDTVRDWRERMNAEGHRSEPPPELTKRGADAYRYPHDFPNAHVPFEYLPREAAKLRRKEGPAYRPSEFGMEARLAGRLAELWDAAKKKTRDEQN